VTVTHKSALIFFVSSQNNFGSIDKVEKVLAARSLSWPELINLRYSQWLRLELSETTFFHLQRLKKKFSIGSFHEYLHQQQLKYVAAGDADYPHFLEYCNDKPLVLFFQGDLTTLKSLSLGIVGTRKITSYGKRVTTQLVTALAVYQPCIVSGFMYGVDKVAHQASLSNGLKTVAVLGHGHQRIKTSDAVLAEKIIAEGGAIISEFAPWLGGAKYTFLQRNRIIAGLSQGVVVTEAGFPSGSLNTAQAALRYGRTVGAIAAPFMSTQAEGTRKLLSEGATLINQAEDLIKDIKDLSLDSGELRITKKISIKNILALLNDAEQQIYLALHQSLEGLDIDGLCEVVNKSAAEVAMVVTNLELKGIIEKSRDVWLPR